MIKGLRWRFVAAAMLSMLVVLAVIVGGMNIISYRAVVTDADAVLALLAENGGRFRPREDIAPPGPPEDDDKGPFQRFDGDEDGPPEWLDDDDRIFGRGGRLASAELEFETRFFTVRLDDEGEAEDVNTDMISAVDETEAVTYAQRAAARRGDAGFIDQYRYLAAEEDGDTLCIFLDCQLTLSSFRAFRRASLIVSAAGLLCVFLLILLLSARITRPAVESYEKQRRFITDASHELKTPLAIIEADADVLEMDVGESEWLSDIRAQVARLSELTKSLVTLSRMEEDKSQFSMIDFPLSDVVSEAAASFQAPALTQNKRFDVEIQDNIMYRGDEKAIRQLVGILLDNALKYSPEGGRVSLSLTRQPHGARLVVYNTAENVDPASLDRLFDRFYRADQSRSSETKGYGIGLSIARAIAMAHKGKIAATSADGKSMTMTVTLG